MKLIKGDLDPASATYWAGNPDYYLGNYFLAYQYLIDVQTISSGGIDSPAANVSPEVWMWLRGAAQANADAMNCPHFIRIGRLRPETRI